MVKIKRKDSCDLFEKRMTAYSLLYRYRRAEAQKGRITLSTQRDSNGDVITSLAKAFVDTSDHRYRQLR